MVFKPLGKRRLNMVSVSVIFVKCHLCVIIYFPVLHDIPVSSQRPSQLVTTHTYKPMYAFTDLLGWKPHVRMRRTWSRCAKAKLPFPRMFVDAESFTWRQNWKHAVLESGTDWEWDLRFLSSTLINPSVSLNEFPGNGPGCHHSLDSSKSWWVLCIKGIVWEVLRS